MRAHLDLAGAASVAYLVLAACGGMAPGSHAAPDSGQTDGAISGDGTTAGNPDGDVFADGSAGDAPGSVVCSGPLADAGFSSLASLPVASLCAGSYLNSVSEAMYPCQGTIHVSWSIGPDCGSYLLFDAMTGALLAEGGGCNTDLGCSGAAAGFQFPIQCFNNGGWWPDVNLCPDGGVDAAAD